MNHERIWTGLKWYNVGQVFSIAVAVAVHYPQAEKFFALSALAVLVAYLGCMIEILVDA